MAPEDVSKDVSLAGVFNNSDCGFEALRPNIGCGCLPIKLPSPSSS